MFDPDFVSAEVHEGAVEGSLAVCVDGVGVHAGFHHFVEFERFNEEVFNAKMGRSADMSVNAQIFDIRVADQSSC